MNQKQIGSFIKELRKEKGITQEQLAERLNVAGRTVSRWETGSNMPDISLLIEIADYFNVSIPEIINGERKGENMNQEEKEIAQKMADYADTEKTILLYKMRIISIAGFIGLLISQLMNPDLLIPVYGYVRGLCLGLSFGSLAVMILYTTGILAKIREYMSKHKLIRIFCIGFLLLGFLVSMIASMIAYFH